MDNETSYTLYFTIGFNWIKQWTPMIEDFLAGKIKSEIYYSVLQYVLLNLPNTTLTYVHMDTNNLRKLLPKKYAERRITQKIIQEFVDVIISSKTTHTTNVWDVCKENCHYSQVYSIEHANIVTAMKSNDGSKRLSLGGFDELIWIATTTLILVSLSILSLIFKRFIHTPRKKKHPYKHPYLEYIWFYLMSFTLLNR